ENSNSSLKKEDVIEAALKANTIIYCVGIGSGTLDEGALKKISERTGGRAYFPEDETELGVAFAQIQQELRSQYLVTYSPANKARDNSYRQLRIEIVNPVLKKQKLKLSYRQGYFARPPAPPAPNNRTTNRTLAKPPRRPKRK
ncbi:MAG: VWA domain-containing protein, partial [Pyrinomonadaceae bacterium]|nr:VWA domain-containing protein [Pyrinomonadaceae bacterium]